MNLFTDIRKLKRSTLNRVNLLLVAVAISPVIYALAEKLYYFKGGWNRFFLNYSVAIFPMVLLIALAVAMSVAMRKASIQTLVILVKWELVVWLLLFFMRISIR